MLNRRSLLMCVPAAAIGITRFTHAQWSTPGMPFTTPRNGNAFAELIGDDFALLTANELVDRVQLRDVVTNNADANLNQFSLHFQSTRTSDRAALNLSDTHYQLLHPKLGLMSVFIQGGGPAREYCAHFCLLRT